MSDFNTEEKIKRTVKGLRIAAIRAGETDREDIESMANHLERFARSDEPKS